MNSPRICTLLLAAGFSLNSALADFVVTNTNSQGAGSLLDAITNSNTISSFKAIRFNLPGSGPWTITITSSLHVSAPVLVDGTTQPGYDGAFNRIYVEGAAGVNEIFFLQAHNGTTIKGLGLYNYNANGVTIWKDSHWNYVDDDYIGFKKTSSGILHNSARANLSAGVGIQGNYNKVRRSTISGVYNGINVGESIEKPPTGLNSHDNLFEYNRI